MHNAIHNPHSSSYTVSAQRERERKGGKEGSWSRSDKCYDEKQSRINGQSGRGKEDAISQKSGRKGFSDRRHLSRDLNEVEEQELCCYGAEMQKGFRQRNYKCKGKRCVLEKNHWGYSGIKKGENKR